MSNAVEKLFDSVLSKLTPESADAPESVDIDDDPSFDIIDEPLDSETDMIVMSRLL